MSFLGLKTGDLVPPITRGPITTRHLVEYAGASLDFNRIHYDEPFARAGGHASVIAHGMLSMAFFGQMAAALGGRITALSARFRAVTYPGDVVRVEGQVAAVTDDTVELKLVAYRSDGTVTLEGSATVAAS